MPKVDEAAREIAFRHFALPACLHIPIAARSVEAIETYIGTTEGIRKDSDRALLVEPDALVERNPRLRIWTIPNVETLHAPQQVWVHVDYTDYRRVYGIAFPDQDLGDRVLDHVLNRQVARLKGFPYVRIVPISRGANSSSGGLSEKWAVQYHSTPEMLARNGRSQAQIQYADLADIVKMLDVKTGGALQDPVNEAQAWLEESR